jgi:hypothetical protein
MLQTLSGPLAYLIEQICKLSGCLGCTLFSPSSSLLSIFIFATVFAPVSSSNKTLVAKAACCAVTDYLEILHRERNACNWRAQGLVLGAAQQPVLPPCHLLSAFSRSQFAGHL